MLPPTSTSANTTTAADILGHVASDIEKYLDFMSILHLSETCRSLQEALVDKSGGNGYHKLKVSHFTLDDPSLVQRRLAVEMPNMPLTTSAVGSFACCALIKLHYPSLKRLHIPLIKAEQHDKDISFAYLALNIGDAFHLEDFFMDVGMVIMKDYWYFTHPPPPELACMMSGPTTTTTQDEMISHAADHTTLFKKTIYEHFADNFARCKKLQIIRIMNFFKDHDKVIFTGTISKFSYYAIGFLNALTPLIRAHRIGSLYEVTVSLGNSPTPGDKRPWGRLDNSSGTYPCWREYSPFHDFFTACLDLVNLRIFNLQLDLASSPLLNNFLDAVEQFHKRVGTLPSSQELMSFTLAANLYKMPGGARSPLPERLSLAPCLALLGNCSHLFMFMVRLPPDCWDCDGLCALQGVLQNKPWMRRLGLYFHDYECTSSPRSTDLLECVLNYLNEHEDKHDNVICISCLKFSDDADAHKWEESLRRYHSREGIGCFKGMDEHGLTFQAKGRMIRW